MEVCCALIKTKWREKPRDVDAKRYTDDNLDELREWLRGGIETTRVGTGAEMVFIRNTHTGARRVDMVCGCFAGRTRNRPLTLSPEHRRKMVEGIRRPEVRKKISDSLKARHQACFK